MRPGFEGPERRFQAREKASDTNHVLLQRKVNGDAIALISRAQPQVVGSNGSDLRDEQEFLEFVFVICRYGLYGLNCTATRHEVFGLQFLAAAGRKVHLKVRKSLVPRSGYTHLWRAILG